MEGANNSSWADAQEVLKDNLTMGETLVPRALWIEPCAVFRTLFFEVSGAFQIGRDAVACGASIQQQRPPLDVLTDAVVVVAAHAHCQLRY